MRACEVDSRGGDAGKRDKGNATAGRDLFVLPQLLWIWWVTERMAWNDAYGSWNVISEEVRCGFNAIWAFGVAGVSELGAGGCSVA